MRIAAFTDPTGAIHRTGLITPRSKADIIAYLSTAFKAMRIIDHRYYRLRRTRTDTGNCLQQLDLFILIANFVKLFP